VVGVTRKVAIVTGASRGLGLAVSQRFASFGWDIVLVARVSNELRDACLHLCEHPSHPEQLILEMPCNVTTPPDVADVIDRVVKRAGRVDVLVCCAGIYGPIGKLEETKVGEWVNAIQTNLIGTMLFCREVLPTMKWQRSGKIVTLSGGGTFPEAGYTAYNASKGGVQRFTEALSLELEGAGVDINAVAPGTLPTRMQMPGAVVADPERAIDNAVDCIAWLASPASDGISGRVFSAIWDDFRIIKPPLGRDDYRMRRVVPA
jgi:NAD(P)-dependent dehydrogenase (short-subunit alcohol dehydrogenase family)